MSDWRSRKARGLVYHAVCRVTGKGYVGLTRKSLAHHIASHAKTSAQGVGREGSIWADIRRHSLDAFDFREVAQAETLGELADLEIAWIASLGTLAPRGYNHNRGGSVAVYPTTYIIDEEEYWGAAELAEGFGLYVETVRKRLQAGWSPRQTAGVDAPPTFVRKGNSYKIGDVVYNSERELCRAYEINNNLFRARYHGMGWSLEEALDLVERDNPDEIFVEGIGYPNLRAACRAFDVPLERIRSRLRLGWSHDEAFDRMPREHRNRLSVCVGDIEYSSLSDAAKSIGVKYSIVVQRLRRGWTVDEAFYGKCEPVIEGMKLPAAHQTDRQPNGQRSDAAQTSFFPVAINGKTYLSCAEIAANFDIGISTVSYRVRSGWPPMEVAGLAPRVAAGKSFLVADQRFASRTAAAKHFGIDLRTFTSRLRYGWTPEEAVGLEPRQRMAIRSYRITHPDGHVSETDNLLAFCRDHGLPSVGNLWMTATSARNHRYRGYSAVILEVDGE